MIIDYVCFANCVRFGLVFVGPQVCIELTFLKTRIGPYSICLGILFVVGALT